MTKAMEVDTINEEYGPATRQEKQLDVYNILVATKDVLHALSLIGSCHFLGMSGGYAVLRTNRHQRKILTIRGVSYRIPK